MPLEFICWSIFHFHIQFRPWLQSRGYVTWDGMNPIGIWGPPKHPTLSRSCEGGALPGCIFKLSCELLGVGSWEVEGDARGRGSSC